MAMTCFHVWEPVKQKEKEGLALRHNLPMNDNPVDYMSGDYHIILKQCKKCGDLAWSINRIVDLEKAKKYYKAKVKRLLDRMDIITIALLIGCTVYLLLMTFLF